MMTAPEKETAPAPAPPPAAIPQPKTARQLQYTAEFLANWIIHLIKANGTALAIRSSLQYSLTKALRTSGIDLPTLYVALKHLLEQADAGQPWQGRFAQLMNSSPELVVVLDRHGINL